MAHLPLLVYHFWGSSSRAPPKNTMRWYTIFATKREMERGKRKIQRGRKINSAMGSRVHQTMIPYTPSMASPNTTLKLLIDKKTQKVLFAEATKEFVDFLFHIFSLPLGSLIQILGSKQMVGCLGELKESVDSFNQTYLQPGIDKDVIFNPEIAFNGNMFLLLNDAFADDKPATSKTLYRCSFTSRSGYYALDGYN